MNEKAKISVIIPTYNSSKYIGKTLKSIWHQTVLPYEVVIVDDGSTDDTLEKIQSFLESHPKIINNYKVIHQENKGAGAARNRGINESSGNWVSFLDSDDTWENNKIEELTKTICSYPNVCIITHNYWIRNSRGERILSSAYNRYKPDKELFVQLYRGNFIATSCTSAKKSIVINKRGFDTTLGYSQDYDLWMKMAYDGANIHVINQPLACYHVRKGNLTSNIKRQYKERLRLWKKYTPLLSKYLTKKKIKKKGIECLAIIHLECIRQALEQNNIPLAAKIGVKMIPSMVIYMIRGD